MKSSPEHQERTLQQYRDALMGEIVSCDPLYSPNWEHFARLLVNCMDAPAVAKAIEAVRRSK